MSMRRACSFYESPKQNRSSRDLNKEEMKENLQKSVEYGSRLFKENKKLQKELSRFQSIRNGKNRCLEDSEEQSRRVLALEKENLEEEIADLKIQLNDSNIDRMKLIEKNEEYKRDLKLIKSNLKRVVKNNKHLRRSNKETRENERFLTRRLSFQMDALEVGNQPPMTTPLKKTRSCRLLSPTSPGSPSKSKSFSSPKKYRSLRQLKMISESKMMDLTRTNSTNDLLKKKQREMRMLKRRIKNRFTRIRDSVDSLKKEIYEIVFFMSQTNTRMISQKFHQQQKQEEEEEYLKDILDKKNEEIEELKSRIQDLEVTIEEKDTKYVAQVQNFLKVFEVNKMYM